MTLSRRRIALISSSVYQRWRPSSSTRPWGREGSAARRPRRVDWFTLKISSPDLPGGESAQLLLVLGRVGLLPDPALHLERLRLKAGEVGVGVHACSCPLRGDVNSCLKPIYADLAENAKPNIMRSRKRCPRGDMSKIKGLAIRGEAAGQGVQRAGNGAADWGTARTRPPHIGGHFWANRGHCSGTQYLFNRIRSELGEGRGIR